MSYYFLNDQFSDKKEKVYMHKYCLRLRLIIERLRLIAYISSLLTINNVAFIYLYYINMYTIGNLQTIQEEKFQTKI